MIGTAYLRLDILPSAEQPGMRQLFRQYLDARLSAYQNLLRRDVADQEFARATAMQQQIWSRAVTAGQIDSTHNIVRIVLPALNDMMDVTTSRAIALDAFAGAHFSAADLCGAAERFAGWACNGETKTSQRAAHDFVRGDYFRHDLRGAGFGRTAIGVDPAGSCGSGADRIT